VQRAVHADYLPNVRSGYRIQIEGAAPPVAGRSRMSFGISRLLSLFRPP